MKKIRTNTEIKERVTENELRDIEDRVIERARTQNERIREIITKQGKRTETEN